jgi:hypothetical protein
LFNKPIFNTTLTGETADRLFSNITAPNGLDKSFLATMRVLLHKRIQENRVSLTCKALHFSEAEIASASTKQALGWFIPEQIKFPTNEQHNIVIIYTTTPNAGAKMLEIIKANTGSGKRHMSSFTRHDDLNVFYARKLNALFYHSEIYRKTVIFTDKLELKQFHALQTMLPKYLPSLFVDSPLTESETALLKSCCNKSAVEYEQLIEEFAFNLDIRAEIIRTKLAGFETAFERQRLEELRGEIVLFESDYENYLMNMRNLQTKIQERKYTLAGLECAIKEKSGDSELVEYFMCNKSLSIIKVSGTGIEFVVHGYADVYDIDAFEQFVKNHDGYMYSGISTRITTSQMEKLYRAIFSECRYKLRLCAAYNADMKTGLKAKQHYSFPPASDTYLHNPHIQQFGCIGTYAGRFQEYMRKKDYVGAIDQSLFLY